MNSQLSSKPVQVGSLLATVVSGGYCIGCGVCASVPNSPLTMQMNDLGQYIPVVSDDYADPEDGLDAGLVCPFYNSQVNETTIARDLYPTAVEDAHIGRSLKVLAGHVTSADIRAQGSSGGLTTWLLTRLLELGHVDGVVHVSSGDRELFDYSISYNVEEVRAASKSRYYPVEMSQVLEFVQEHPGRYAFVGVPCFIKSLRLFARADPTFSKCLVFTVAIFCGHLKSSGYAQMLAWQMGVSPEDLRDIDFRVKLPGRPASRYGVSATGSDGVQIALPVHDLYGTNWGEGLFKPQACDYCDDVAGETADIAFGDAWLPQYVNDSNGTNIVIVRSPMALELIDEGVSLNQIHVDSLDAASVIKSQAGNYRHRRDGLSYRLWLKEQDSVWHPPKRVPIDKSHLTAVRRQIYEVRSELSRESHTAFLRAKHSADLEGFKKSLAPLRQRYRRLYNPTWRRVARGIKRTMQKWLASF